MKNRIFKIVLLLCIPFLGNVNALSNPHGGPIPIRILIQEDSRNLWMWGLGFFGLCCVGHFAVKKYPQVQERFKKILALKNIPDYCVGWYLNRNGQVAISREDVDALVQQVSTVVVIAEQTQNEAEALKAENQELGALLQEAQRAARTHVSDQAGSQQKSFWSKVFGPKSGAQQSSSPVQNNPFSGVESALERSRKHRQANQQSQTALRQRQSVQIEELPDNESNSDARHRLAITPAVSSTALSRLSQNTVSEHTVLDNRFFEQADARIAFCLQSDKTRELHRSFPTQIVGLTPAGLFEEANKDLPS